MNNCSSRKLGMLTGCAALVLGGCGAQAMGYESSRMFFQHERARAERGSPFGGRIGHPAVQQQSFGSPYKVTRMGVPLKAGWYHSLTPDCRSQGRTQVNVVNGPRNGEVYTRIGNEYPGFPTSNTHAVCNRRAVSATVVYYKPSSGFVGTDRFTIEVVFPSGNAKQATYTVSVR